MALTRKVELHVGTGFGQLGIVTNDRFFRGGTTGPVGWTIDAADTNAPGDYVQVFAGTTDGVNRNEVSPSYNHRGGSTESIGYLSLKPIQGGTKLYVEIGPNTNVTNSTKNKKEPTKFLGYTIPNP